MTTLEEYLKFNPYDSEEERNLAEFAQKIQDDRDKWRGIAEMLAKCFPESASIMPLSHIKALMAFEEARK